jgi:hypothetical protein
VKLSKDEENIINELHGIPKDQHPKVLKLIQLIKFDFLLTETVPTTNFSFKSFPTHKMGKFLGGSLSREDIYEDRI